MKPTLDQAAHDSHVAARTSAGFEIVDLGPFDNNRNDVLAINDAGQCAGVSSNPESGRIEAFRQESGTRDMLGTLGGSFSIALGINNHGEIIGIGSHTGEDRIVLLRPKT